MPNWVDFLVKPTKYSNYNLSTTKRGSCSPGILYPVWYGIMNPGEIFRMNLRSLIRTNPVKSPLMGRFKVRLVTVVANFKNYAVGLEGYRRSFDWRTFRLPFLRFGFDADASLVSNTAYGKRMVHCTSLMDYLGYQVDYMPNSTIYEGETASAFVGGSAYEYKYIDKNALPFLVYYDFYRNYLVNPQLGFYPFFAPGLNGVTFVRMNQISHLDEMFEQIHKYYDGDANLPVNNITVMNTSGSEQVVPGALYSGGYPSEVFRYNYFLYNSSAVSSINYCSTIHGGLVGTMFDPDINTQWLSTNNYARLQAVRVNSQGSSSSEGGVYTNFEDIVKASSLWDFISREVYSGGTYADHIYSQFGVSVKSDMNIPQIVHVFDSMVDFEDITSQSETDGAVVGEQFGVGRGYGQSSRFTIRNLDNNYAYAMTFMWITPMVDYASGVPADSNITSFADLFTPAFDNYSMQPRLAEQVDASSVFSDYDNLELSNEQNYLDRVVGYQPAYTEYKTDTNRIHGLFSGPLSYWAIIRKFPRVSDNITSYTSYPTYVYESPIGAELKENDAQQYETAFSVVNEDNFFYQLRFDIVASRPMSKSVMPHVK